ncbi:hypothetical protein [Aurantimonas sp. Leaf443]|uniref:hypothetical protein n=1 Tax=Aurantimonas sp. Leaf443 TaxID=1736378 RepID=UPI0006F831ED|nr:hypothetical protein [Aurantimonas sp. Leaf443]KQT88267.1 hypothetical protein ASG48_02210 [Aurantimonas sp. Leaf443]
MTSKWAKISMLVAGFGFCVGLLATGLGERPGGAFVAADGRGCDYTAGIVCPIAREPGRF